MPEAPSFRTSELGRAAHRLVQTVALRPLAVSHREISEESELSSYMATVALDGGFVAERVDFYEDDIGAALSGPHPFLFVPLPEGISTYAVARGGTRSVTFVNEDGLETIVAHAAAKQALLRHGLEHIGRIAERLDTGVLSRERLASVLREELLGSTPVGWGYVLRPNLAESLPGLAKHLRVGSYVAKLLALSIVQSALGMLAWVIIGSLALSGHPEPGRLAGWALLSLTATLVQTASTRFVGRFTIRAATSLRERLLEGSLELDAEDLGSYGLGGLMVLASQADSFLNAVIALLLSLLSVLTNVLAAFAVLSIGPMPTITMPCLAVFLFGVVLSFPYRAKLLSRQQAQQMQLTTDLVERMLGHRTRLVQQTPSTWHDGEDDALHSYALNGRRVEWVATVSGALPRVYYLVTLASLFAVLASNPTQVTLALAFGGMALGSATLASLAQLVGSAASLYVLHSALRPLVRSGKRREPRVLSDEAERGTGTIVEMRGVRFGYETRPKPVFDDANLVLRAGERVLVEGSSGGGKTTFAALLTGMRKPDAGLVLVRGLDQHTISEAALRRAIASAPQFYRNHIFTGPLAFNLLLGRTWPPDPSDLREALQVSRAIGLGPLLERMPGGIFQHVGQTGWQLSHGEKSRVYLARTLLQRSDLVVLDETFGALDPDTLRRCIRVVLERAPSLVVITHR